MPATMLSARRRSLASVVVFRGFSRYSEVLEMEQALLGRDGLPRYWWSQLCAIPPSNRGLNYERLKRVWFDQTGCRNWFRNSRSEGHMVATLFENFVLFEPSVWVPEMFQSAG